MNITFRTQPEPTIPLSVQQDLERNHPTIRLVWNPFKYKLREFKEKPIWEPRWDIYVELVPNTHDKNRFAVSEKDKSVNGAIWRYVQTWEDPENDDAFAPIDSRFTTVLKMADIFRTRRFYEEHIIAPEEQARQEEKDWIRELAYAGRHRYFDLDNPVIGLGSRGNWRYKLR